MSPIQIKPLLFASAALELLHRACSGLRGGSAAAAAFAAAPQALGMAAALLLGGCAALPAPSERAPSMAMAQAEVGATTLARMAASQMDGAARAESGFRLLGDDSDAFETRIALIRSAEKTLDVQYYLIADDRTGREFLGELVQASERGVRVRILVDDLQATGEDELLALAAAHANVEVRLFNPLPVRNASMKWRIALSLHQLARINHRMHNKLLIADGAYAVTGGRNIADEYFGRGRQANFFDMDLLSAGPVVGELAAVFDDFWNARMTFKLKDLARSQVDARASHPGLLLAAVATTTRLYTPLHQAVATVLADRSDKALGLARSNTVASSHLQLLRSARDSVLVASPYFVPDGEVMAVIGSLRTRNIRMSLLTNSGTATDEPLVHAGYARRRGELLQAGVAIDELFQREAVSDGSTQEPKHRSSLARLHAKLTVIDDRHAFVGSMNMDARSAHLNTESALVVESPVIARALRQFVADSIAACGSTRGQDGGGSSRNADTPPLRLRLLALLVGESNL